MLQQERHEQILARLNTDGKVKVKELAVDFEVTEDCIRKDLTALEKEGLLKRIHGGAMQVRKNLHAYHVDERMSVRLTQKKIISKKEVELIDVYNAIKNSKRIYPDSIVKELKAFKEKFSTLCQKENISLPDVSIDEISSNIRD